METYKYKCIGRYDENTTFNSCEQCVIIIPSECIEETITLLLLLLIEKFEIEQLKYYITFMSQVRNICNDYIVADIITLCDFTIQFLYYSRLIIIIAWPNRYRAISDNVLLKL